MFWTKKTAFWLLFILPMLWVGAMMTSSDIALDLAAAKVVERLDLGWTWVEQQHWYIMINLGTIVFPFILSFDRKVHFYRKWRYLWPGIILVGALFIAWDVYFTGRGVWGFNERYCSYFIFGLPLGEWLFFMTVPYACVFTHECLRAYFPSDPLKSWDKAISWFLILSFLFIGLTNLWKAYTSWTFLLTAAILFWHYWFFPNSYRTLFYRSYLVCLIPFILVNGVLTGAINEEPVVLYNNAHNLSSVLGQRFLSIPYDDFVYGFLLLFLNIALFEELRKAQSQRETI